ncbi:MAG: endonuclease III [Pseudothermotoga sp.]|uniref:endonuclease III n=1 Tax=Pseudothermotoga sp. TaxID=2033661 RepID=UPI0019B0C79F|nr:endonuclease III [Pseudothermotoga sp.]MBC7123308.1 endonuclease III [Pseudothermotoga sp.]MDI6862116.1 endonuclease III [Pseudothermotoga sp.]
MNEPGRIVEKIVKLFPRERFSSDPFKILICTILSQRTRDENTESACEKLFARYKDVFDLAKASPIDLYELIKKSGMYRQKAQRIVEVAKILVEKYGGKVPDKLEELLRLPGVGRKTANIVLYQGFGRPAIAVDTHVHRISNRLGLVKTKRPDETEEQLKKVIPKRLWGPMNGSMVEFGRRICLPVRPRCENCPLNQECNYFLQKRR